MNTPYEYIHRVYGCLFFPGDVVEHDGNLTRGELMRGEVLPPKDSHEHYVQVRFSEGRRGLCHPRALKIIARGKRWGDWHRAQDAEATQ